jgi:hypothetical protein
MVENYRPHQVMPNPLDTELAHVINPDASPGCRYQTQWPSAAENRRLYPSSAQIRNDRHISERRVKFTNFKGREILNYPAPYWQCDVNLREREQLVGKPYGRQ